MYVKRRNDNLLTTIEANLIKRVYRIVAPDSRSPFSFRFLLLHSNTTLIVTHCPFNLNSFGANLWSGVNSSGATEEQSA